MADLALNEQQTKRELNRERKRAITKEKLSKLDTSLSGFQGATRTFNPDKDSQVSQSIRKTGKSINRVKKGAVQVAAGNKVSGAVNIARGTKDLAADFFSGGFTKLGALWFFMFLLAITKDTFDIMFVEVLWWADWIVDIVVGGGLWVYMAVHNVKKGKIIKYVTPIMEILPFTGILPTWTVSIVAVAVLALKNNE